MTAPTRYVLIILLTVCSLCANTQTPLIDSLRQRIHHATGEEEKLQAIFALCGEYKSLNRDTLTHYAYLARELASRSNNTQLKNAAELCVAYDYFRWGWMDSARVTVEPVVREQDIRSLHDRALYFKASRLKAMSYAQQSRYVEGLELLYQLVNEAETYRDSLTLGENMNTIGSVALARNQPGDALNWLQKALAVSTNDHRYKPIRAAIYVNMAQAFHQLGKNDSASLYIRQGIDLFREVQNLSNLALALQRQATILTSANLLPQAEASLKEMIDVRKQSGDSAMFQDDNLSLIHFYLQTGQVSKAIDYCQKVLATGDVHESAADYKVFANSITIRLGYYEALAKCYKLAGDQARYQETLENIIAAKDSFHYYNAAGTIAELETKYEVQKKENTIIQQQLDLSRKNSLFYGLLGLALFVGVVSWLIFVGYTRREKLKMAHRLEKEKELAKQSVAIAEEKERKRIAADLHDSLGAYAASIVSNTEIIEINPENTRSLSAVTEVRNNSRAIVSQLNDTIWALKKDALALTAISDRTKIFIQRMQASYPDTIINVQEQIGDDITLSPAHAFHLFSTIQEAVNNTLKHSGAGEITISFESGNGSWTVAVSDNGTGMQQQHPGAGGNGLSNMRTRAGESGWDIRWQANPGGGTSVVILSTTN